MEPISIGATFFIPARTQARTHAHLHMYIKKDSNFVH